MKFKKVNYGMAFTSDDYTIVIFFPVDGYLSCFSFFTVTNNALINIHVAM